MGPVFRTYDPQRDRLIAVKAFRLDIVPEHVARLAESLRRLAAAQLSHPGIVPPVDAGLEGTTAFLAMEYVAAETLDVALRHLAPAPLDRALPLLSQVAAAIDAAWAAGFGHGALHPRDVFVTVDTNDVRVTGFGVVPALEAIGVKPPVRRPYTAPERVSGEAWDSRADVYSLGAIAHELLTRRRPAGPGEQDGALTTATTPEERVLIRRVLSAALAEHPESRFSSAEAFVDALAAVARGEAPVGLPEAEHKRAKGGGLKTTPPLLALAEEVYPEPAPMPAPSEVHAAIETFAPETANAAPSTSVADASSTEPVRTEDAPASPVSPSPSDTAVASAPIDSPFRPHPAAPSTWHPAPAPVTKHEAPGTAFPWLAVGAVAAAGIALGVVIGYQYGRRTVPAAPPPAAVATSRPADTEVPVPPEVSRPQEPAPEVKAPPPAVARAANTPGRITVRTVPSGALLVVDGRPRGQTPATVRDLALGAHTIEVGRPGYVPRSERVTLSARDAVRTLSLHLQPGRDEAAPGSAVRPATQGSIYVDSRPQAARVIIDGRAVGTTPLSVPEMRPGPHAVHIETDGHRPFDTTIVVKAGEKARVMATLIQR